MTIGDTVILDRSIFSDWVFAEKNRIDGNISQEGFEFYSSVRQKMLSLLPLPHYTIYLRVSAEECYRRIKFLRKRECESGISLDYLIGLGEAYETLMDELANSGAAVLFQNWDKFGDVTQIVHHLENKLPLNEWKREVVVSRLVP